MPLMTARRLFVEQAEANGNPAGDRRGRVKFTAGAIADKTRHICPS